MEPPEKGLEFWTPDDVSECLDGISGPTSGRLWQLLNETEPPVRGEWPEPIGSKSSVVAVWDKLTHDQQKEINRAFRAWDAQYDGLETAYNSLF